MSYRLNLLNPLSGAIAALVLTASAQAQVVNIEEIIITATRTDKPINAIPNTVRVVGSEQLDTQLALSTSLLDGLSFSIPSLAPGREKLTSNGVTLRGRTPLYLLDGVPQSTPLRNGRRSGYTIDPVFIDRVEVIYGANAIQGVGATGGIINSVTVSAPESGDWLKRISLDLTSDDLESHGLHYKTAALVGKKAGARDFVVGAAFDKRDLYYDGEGNPVAVDPIQGDTMDSLSWNLFSKYGINISDSQRLDFSLNLFEMEGDGDYRIVPGDKAIGIPASSEKGWEEGDPTRNEAINLTASYRHDDFYQGTLTAQAYYYDFYALYGGGFFPVFQDTTIAPEGELFDQSALNSEKYGTKLTYVRNDVFWQGLQVATGLDYLSDETYQELAQTDRLWVPEMQFKGWAPFIQLEQSFLQDKILLSAGARQENVTLEVPTFTTVAAANNTLVQGASPDFDKWLTNMGVVFEPVSGLSFYASYAEGFTMPDAGLILRAVNTPNQSVEELVDLQPIIADNLEIGVNFNYQGVDLSASYFSSDSDLGSRIEVIGGAGFVQREKTKIDGFEFAAIYNFEQGLQVGANFATLDGRYDSDDDGGVDRDLDGRNISPDRLNLWLQSAFGQNVVGRIQVANLFDREFEGGLPEHNFEGYRLLDVLVKYRNDRYGEFSLGIQNAVDEHYLTYFSQTVTYVGNRDYVAGRGRVFHLGWDKSF